ncbi:regulatory protein RecX [Aureimonas psammosilenae]|uniref:regulatory protein RecX n=1 Tax=Aureimonas psammosilenae TaxID=2495496 RepID=UPI001F407396|nr:regulatory protein RecX [Aureimonas psammosilenae]
MAKPPRPKPINGDWLFRAAAHYLERYASSADNLRRVLRRKIDRRLETHDDPPDDDARAAHAQLIEETLERFAELRLVDDKAFAEAKLRSLRRVGASSRQAAAKLSQKGVDRTTVEDALRDDETSDREAAHRYAKRRRFGPHRMRDRKERRERDIAAMMRAGFALADARAAIDGEPEED